MKTLYPFQDEALRRVWERIESSTERKALVVMATGLGKTVLAAAFVRQWLERNMSRVLFLAHTNDILRQARLEFQEALGESITTGIINAFEWDRFDADVLFSTFQSMQGLLSRIKPEAFGLVIVDEAHHGQAVTYKEVIEYFRPDFLFGMTATPDRSDGLDIRDIFGEELCSYPLAFGLAHSYLSPVEYRVLTDNISIRRLRELAKQVSEGVRVSRAAIDATIFLPERFEVIAQMLGESPERTIIFCRSTEHIEQALPHFANAQPYHSYLPEKVLRERFHAFRHGDLRILLVVNKFNEGVDIPDAERIVFLRGTDSKTLWLQQLGRGLRRVEGKDRVLVLDFVANCDRVLWVHELGREVTKHTGTDLPDSLVIEGLDFEIQFSEELRDLLSMLERLEVELYPTLNEAMEAVQRLNPVPRTRKEYEKTRSQDPCLPSNPNVFYKDKGWISYYHFLQKGFYHTLEEAQEAVQCLNPVPKTEEEYRKTRSQDPRLPSAPDQVYKNKGWVNWKHFLQTNFYQTIEEAMDAIQRLDPIPTTIEEYKKICLQNSCLPRFPYVFYRNKGWVSWFEFLGKKPRLEFYSTLEEAIKAVQNLRPIPRTEREYHKVYIQDPRLPAAPYQVYKNKGWVNWFHFLGKLKQR